MKDRHSLTLALAVIAASGLSIALNAQDPTLVIPTAADWRYRADGADPGTAWREPAYNDLDWNVGRAKLGFGGDGESTVIGHGSNAYTAFYFRRTFTLSNAPAFASLTARLLRDDGAVVLRPRWS